MKQPGFPLDAYLQRIGLSHLPANTAAGLHSLVVAQTMNVPFENLDPLAGEPVLIDGASIAKKILHGRRGGYCYELNGLLRKALGLAGFEFEVLLARVSYRKPAPGPLLHEVVRVALDDGDWLVDVGFGGPGLTAPMCLRPGEICEQAHGTFRLLDEGARGLHLQRQEAGQWINLYLVTQVVATPQDLEMGNHFVSTHPTSPFVRQFMCVAPQTDGTWQIEGQAFVFRDLAGHLKESRDIRTPEQLVEGMQSLFHLQVPIELAQRAVSRAYELAQAERS